MTHLDNPIYTYKGFRLQALYSLYEIFRSSDMHTFQPEGVEDLVVYHNKKLIKAVQVKSGDNSLSLSHFKTFF